jgi:hypothetical protein
MLEYPLSDEILSELYIFNLNLYNVLLSLITFRLILINRLNHMGTS